MKQHTGQRDDRRNDIADGLGKKHREHLVRKEIRQNENQRNQQNQLSQAGHNQAHLRLPQSHKRLLAADFDKVLSLDLLTAAEALKADDAVDAELEAYVLEKIEERKAAKKEKDFAKADAIRAELLEKGIVIEDTREGVKWRKA